MICLKNISSAQKKKVNAAGQQRYRDRKRTRNTTEEMSPNTKKKY